MNLMPSKFNQIWDDLKNEFQFSTIKDCSFDTDNKVYLIDQDLEKAVFDFDHVTEEWAREKLGCRKPRSVDALYMESDNLHLVEFKNQVDIDHNKVKAKIHDTLSLLNYFYKFKQSDFEKIKITLVRNGKKVSPKGVGHRRLDKKSGSSCPPSLEFLQKVYRIKISKVTKDEFLQKLQVS